jgi:hypothetical protein
MADVMFLWLHVRGHSALNFFPQSLTARTAGPAEDIGEWLERLLPTITTSSPCCSRHREQMFTGADILPVFVMLGVFAETLGAPAAIIQNSRSQRGSSGAVFLSISSPANTVQGNPLMPKALDPTQLDRQRT